MSYVRKVGDESNNIIDIPDNIEEDFITWLKKDQSIYIRFLNEYKDIFKINIHKSFLNGKVQINICHQDIIVNYYSEKTGLIFDECEYCYKSSSNESYWTVVQIVDKNGILIDDNYRIWLIQPYKFTDTIRPFHENQIRKDKLYNIKSFIFKLNRSRKGNYNLSVFYKPNNNNIKKDFSDEIIINKILNKYI
jgi:hypothetical protein